MDKALQNNDRCKDYTPGDAMGTTRRICKYYIRQPPDAAGACTRPEHFMCEYWMEKQKK
jgi:hypothetical protein